MSLERIKFEGYFASDTTEVWTTFGLNHKSQESPPRREGCMLNQIEQFILHDGQSPFIPKVTEESFDDEMDDDGDVPDWSPHYAWSWKEDETWRYADFSVDISRGKYTSLDMDITDLIPM